MSPALPALANASPSFREVFDEQAPFVWRSLLALGVPESDVPDASQQVFLVLHRKWGDLQPGCKVSTFAYGICLRVAADFRNRAHTRREIATASPGEQATGPSAEGIAARNESLRRLEIALGELPAHQREIFVLYEIEEQSMTDVAAAVGVPVQTAYSRLHAARRAVLSALGEAHLVKDGEP